VQNDAAIFVVDAATVQLIRCLDEWCTPKDWLYLDPSRRHLSAGMRALIAALRVSG
jgi:hypothetical protein